MARRLGPSGLEEHMGFWLRVLSNHVHRSFEAELERFDVSVAQWVVLRRLFGADAMSVTELAEATGVDQGAMSRMVERLAKRELVERARDESDGRARRLTLSESGRRLVPKLAGAADRNDERFFGAITASERAELRRIVKKLLEAHAVPAEAND